MHTTDKKEQTEAPNADESRSALLKVGKALLSPFPVLQARVYCRIHGMPLPESFKKRTLIYEFMTLMYRVAGFFADILIERGYLGVADDEKHSKIQDKLIRIADERLLRMLERQAVANRKSRREIVMMSERVRRVYVALDKR